MLYVAEVPVVEDDLDGQMSRMRAWLDHQHFEPSGFRFCRVGGRQVIRVLFKFEAQSAAFASEFSGSVLASAGTDAVIG